MKGSSGMFNFWSVRIKNMSISKKISLIYVVLFVPLFFITAFITYYLGSMYILNMTIENNMLVLKNTMAQLDNVIKDMERISLMTISDRNLQRIVEKGNISYDYDYLQDQKWFEQFFLNLSTIRNDISTIRIVTPSQVVYKYCKLSYPMKPGYDYSRETWLALARENGGRAAFIGTHYVRDVQIPESASETRKMAFSVVRQINSLVPANKPLGYVKIDSDLGVMESIINRYKGKNSEIIICDSAMNILYHKDYKLITGKLGDLFNTERISSAKQGNYIMGARDGNMLVTFLTSDYCNWKIISLTPEYIFKSSAVFVRNVELFIICIGILMSIGISILLSKAITKNIVRLNKSMKKVETGNLEVSLEPLSGDEIGELTRTFNTMVTRLNELVGQEYLERIKRQEAEIKQKHAELCILQNQIDPHFLYNTLDTIRITAALNNDKPVEEMLFILSSFFRLSVYRGEDNTTVEKEIELIKCYMKIHKFRFRDKIDFYFDIPEEILDYTIPRFILQPIVENSVHHGLELKKGKGVLKIEAAMNDFLEITISDNGKGMSAEEIDRHNSMFRDNIGTQSSGDSMTSKIGLLNVHQRIALKYGKPYGLELMSNHEGGLTVKIKLPGLPLF